MKRILRYLLGFAMIVVGSILGLEAMDLWQYLRVAAAENSSNFMTITSIEIIGYRFGIGPYTATLCAVSVVLVWIGIRCIMPGHFIRHDSKAS